MATIRDVARDAGVSTATVSNVLNGRTERASETTIERVLASVRALKYRPTPMEHKQKAIQTRNIGLIVSDMNAMAFRVGGYHQEIFHGVLEGAASRGYSLTIFIEKIWDNVGLAIRRSYDGRCDGLILVAPQIGNEVAERLHARGTPVVAVGSTPWLPNFASVDVDNHTIGVMAANHFLELGHRKLALVLDSRPQISAKERAAGFLEAAVQFGLPEEQAQIIQPVRSTPEEEFKEIFYRFTGPSSPTAALFWHDGLAARFIEEANKIQPELLRRLSILGVDNALEAQQFGISSFTNPTHEIGVQAAKILIERLESSSDDNPTVRLPSELILRHSTQPNP